jgi:predicted ArsR family transcriptional regulator
MDSGPLIEALADPQRRALYEELQQAGEPRTRRELAELAGIGPSLVSFHLDKLIAAGLVEVAGNRVTGSRGRPAVGYRARATEALISLPSRRYELASELLLEAARDDGAGGFLGGLRRAARRHGRTMAAAEPPGRAGKARRLHRLLASLGYEPKAVARETVFLNCPFDRLRHQDVELTCEMNLALVHGCVEGLGLEDDYAARLDPTPDRCCVVVSERVSS